jgi:hypothetical protein
LLFQWSGENKKDHFTDCYFCLTKISGISLKSEHSIQYVGFEVLMTVGTKMAVFCVVVLCSLVEIYHRVLIALMMAAARSSETLVNFYQTTWHYNPEDSHHSIQYPSLLSSVRPVLHSQDLPVPKPPEKWTIDNNVDKPVPMEQDISNPDFQPSTSNEPHLPR